MGCRPSSLGANDQKITFFCDLWNFVARRDRIIRPARLLFPYQRFERGGLIRGGGLMRGVGRNPKRDTETDADEKQKHEQRTQK